MRSLHTRSLQQACKRYGPGRLPGADEPAIGAGYAAASAALAASVLFAAAVLVADATGIVGTLDGPVLAAFAGMAVPIVVPTAFVVGVAVWRALPSTIPAFGPVAGVLGVLGTYVGTFLVVTSLLTVSAVLGFSGAEPVSAAVFSFAIVGLAFMLTWWVTVPVGAVSGTVYASVVAERA